MSHFLRVLENFSVVLRFHPGCGTIVVYAMIYNLFIFIFFYRFKSRYGESVFVGGKAKALKNPTVDKKNYDEVCFEFVVLWIFILDATFGIEEFESALLLLFACVFLGRNHDTGLFVLVRILGVGLGAVLDGLFLRLRWSFPFN